MPDGPLELYNLGNAVPSAIVERVAAARIRYYELKVVDDG